MLLQLPEPVTRAASVEGMIVIAIIYAVLTVLGKLKGAAKEPPKPVARPRRQPGVQSQPRHHQQAPPPARREPTPDTQSEARRLEELLRGLAGLPEEGPMGRPSRTQLPSAEDFEERESLEVDREAVSLERDEPDRRRVEVDQDEGAEALVNRRMEEALARNRPLTQKDHQEFDQRLRAVVVKKSAGPARKSRQRLRDAIIWREILGPPLALRDVDRPEA